MCEFVCLCAYLCCVLICAHGQVTVDTFVPGAPDATTVKYISDSLWAADDAAAAASAVDAASAAPVWLYNQQHIMPHMSTDDGIHSNGISHVCSVRNVIMHTERLKKMGAQPLCEQRNSMFWWNMFVDTCRILLHKKGEAFHKWIHWHLCPDDANYFNDICKEKVLMQFMN